MHYTSLQIIIIVIVTLPTGHQQITDRWPTVCRPTIGKTTVCRPTVGGGELFITNTIEGLKIGIPVK